MMPNKADLAVLMKAASPLPWTQKNKIFTVWDGDSGVIHDDRIGFINHRNLGLLVAAVNAVPELLLLREFYKAKTAMATAMDAFKDLPNIVNSEALVAANNRYLAAADALKEFYDAGK